MQETDTDIATTTTQAETTPTTRSRSNSTSSTTSNSSTSSTKTALFFGETKTWKIYWEAFNSFNLSQSQSINDPANQENRLLAHQHACQEVGWTRHANNIDLLKAADNYAIGKNNDDSSEEFCSAFSKYFIADVKFTNATAEFRKKVLEGFNGFEALGGQYLLELQTKYGKVFPEEIRRFERCLNNILELVSSINRIAKESKDVFELLRKLENKLDPDMCIKLAEFDASFKDLQKAFQKEFQNEKERGIDKLKFENILGTESPAYKALAEQQRLLNVESIAIAVIQWLPRFPLTFKEILEGQKEREEMGIQPANGSSYTELQELNERFKAKGGVLNSYQVTQDLNKTRQAQAGKLTQALSQNDTIQSINQQEDIIRQINFIAAAAVSYLRTEVKTLIDSEKEPRTKKINEIKEAYLKLIADQKPLDAKEIITKLKIELSPYIDSAVVIDTNVGNSARKLKKFNNILKWHASREKQRSNVVVDLGMGQVEASLRDNETTKGEAAKKEKPSIKKEIIASKRDDGSFEVKFVGYSPPSFVPSPLEPKKDILDKLDDEITTLENSLIEMAKEQIKLQGLLPGQTLELSINLTSLYTPWKRNLDRAIQEVLGLFGINYKISNRQLRLQHRIFEFLNGQTISITTDEKTGKKVNVRFSLSHINIPAKISRSKVSSLSETNIDHYNLMSKLQNDVINPRGFGRYCESQEKILQRCKVNAQHPHYSIMKRIELFIITQTNDLQGLADNIKTKEEALVDIYKEIRKNLPNRISKKDYLTLQKKANKLEAEIARDYVELLEKRKQLFAQNQKEGEALAQNISPILTTVMDPVVKQALQQFIYYFDVQKQFYSGAYKKPANVNLFLAQFIRSGDLANVRQFSKREGLVYEHLNILIKAENELGRPLRYGNAEDREYVKNLLPTVVEKGIKRIFEKLLPDSWSKRSLAGPRRQVEQREIGATTATPALPQTVQPTKLSVSEKQNDLHETRALKKASGSPLKLSSLEEYLESQDQLDKPSSLSAGEIKSLQESLNQQLARFVKRKDFGAIMEQFIMGDKSDEAIRQGLEKLSRLKQKVDQLSSTAKDKLAIFESYFNLLPFKELQNPVLLRATMDIFLINKVGNGQKIIWEPGKIEDVIFQVNQLFKSHQQIKAQDQAYIDFLKLVGQDIPGLNCMKDKFLEAVKQHNDLHRPKFDRSTKHKTSPHNTNPAAASQPASGRLQSLKQTPEIVTSRPVLVK